VRVRAPPAPNLWPVARATSGHATAAPPPRRAMNSRYLMGSPEG